MKIPIISKCILKRVYYHITDKNFTSGNNYLHILPIFLQFILLACDIHILQHPDCFIIIKEIILHSHSSESTSDRIEGVKIMDSRKDSLDTIVHLIGCGYVLEPFTFLNSLLSSLDATLVRYLVFKILKVCKPPFSEDFVIRILEFMTSKRYFIVIYYLLK